MLGRYLSGPLRIWKRWCTLWKWRHTNDKCWLSRSNILKKSLLDRSNRARASAIYYLTRVAFKLMGVEAKALETGQLTLAAWAIRWNVASSIPGTTASVSRSIGLIAKPPSTGLK